MILIPKASTRIDAYLLRNHTLTTVQGQILYTRRHRKTISPKRSVIIQYVLFFLATLQAGHADPTTCHASSRTA